MIVGLLALSASGAPSLLTPEPCGGSERADDLDGACLPMCVTCGCCAQPAVPMTVDVERSGDERITDVDVLLPLVAKTHPRDILHVPKARRA
jgi:hypothetical protein